VSHFPEAQKRSSLDEATLLGSGIVDSLGILALVSFIEAEFDIVISEEELRPDNFRTIASMAAFVHAKLNSEASRGANE
jgi:acyl carrier protein